MLLEKESFLSTTDSVAVGSTFSKTTISANLFSMNTETQLIIVKTFPIMIMKIKTILDLK